MSKYTPALFLTLAYLLICIWARLDPWSCIISIVYALAVVASSTDKK